MQLELNAIVAISDKSKGIGKNNDLPWSLPDDWNYFLRFIKTTKSACKMNALIMGRNTWQSIKDLTPFKSCLIVIISKSLKVSDLENCLVVDSFELALEVLNSPKYIELTEKIIAVGGSNIYETSFKATCLKRLYLTRVFGDFDCDVFIQPEDFLNNFKKLTNNELIKETSVYRCDYNKIRRDSDTGIEYIFEVYEKNI